MSNPAIAGKFAELKRRGEKAYVPYVCCGDPSLEFSRDLVHCLIDSGADLIELGIPFSDTLADGQTIQSASERALKNGITVAKSLEFIESLREEGVKVPLLPMTYYNLVFHHGVDNFCARASQAGASGLLVPDVPLEESALLKAACEKNGLDLIYFIAPTTGPLRMEKILSAASGFVYAVAVTGVTGARESLQEETKTLIKSVKELSKIPVAVGFGISKPEHARTLVEAGADAIVEGSQLIKIYSELLGNRAFFENKKRALEEIRAHAISMKTALLAGAENSAGQR